MIETPRSPAGTAPPGDPFVAIEKTPFDRQGRGGLSAVRDRLRRVVAVGPGPRVRLGGHMVAVLVAVLGLLVVAATDQIVPATSAHQAQLRIWLASRAAGVTALLLLGLQVLIGLLLSHPKNKTTWRLSHIVVG